MTFDYRIYASTDMLLFAFIYLGDFKIKNPTGNARGRSCRIQRNIIKHLSGESKHGKYLCQVCKGCLFIHITGMALLHIHKNKINSLIHV